jgi:thiamine pyrophosphate-dependent acetolactate synthase large subunit-like protein
MADALACADLLVRRLRDYGVREVFGYPGGQLTPVYDALFREPALRHVLARDEQAAGFMADGYARATGRPGVALAVCGPGVLNAATPLATSFTDSVPVLLITGQVPIKGLGPRSGYYHENDQLSACATFTKWRCRVENPHQLLPLLDEAVVQLTTGRPGPVLFEVPLDVLRAEVQLDDWPAVPAPALRPAPRPAQVAALAELLTSWRRPLILAGGGVVTAGATDLLRQLAERLGAPVHHTAMGKGAFPASHPLAAGMPWVRATSDLTGMDAFLSPRFAQADGLLAIGCRFTQLATGSWTLRLPASLAQIDIDASEIGRHYPVHLAIVADAAETLRALLQVLPEKTPAPRMIREPPAEPWRLPGLDLVGPLRRVLPSDAIVAADVTRLAYMLMADFPLDRPRCFLHPAGSVAMGYGVPAALGAKAAFPGRKVVAVVGDGCFLMSAMELATAVQERLPIVIVLVNDSTLTLIKATQQRRYAERYIGVDLLNPDFALLARAFGVVYRRADDDAAFEAALRDALDLEVPVLLEVRPADAGGRL